MCDDSSNRASVALPAAGAGAEATGDVKLVDVRKSPDVRGIETRMQNQLTELPKTAFSKRIVAMLGGNAGVMPWKRCVRIVDGESDLQMAARAVGRMAPDETDVRVLEKLVILLNDMDDEDGLMDEYLEIVNTAKIVTTGMPVAMQKVVDNANARIKGAVQANVGLGLSMVKRFVSEHKKTIISGAAVAAIGGFAYWYFKREKEKELTATPQTESMMVDKLVKRMKYMRNVTSIGTLLYEGFDGAHALLRDTDAFIAVVGAAFGGAEILGLTNVIKRVWVSVGESYDDIFGYGYSDWLEAKRVGADVNDETCKKAVYRWMAEYHAGKKPSWDICVKANQPEGRKILLANNLCGDFDAYVKESEEAEYVTNFLRENVGEWTSQVVGRGWTRKAAAVAAVLYLIWSVYKARQSKNSQTRAAIARALHKFKQFKKPSEKPEAGPNRQGGKAGRRRHPALHQRMKAAASKFVDYDVWRDRMAEAAEMGLDVNVWSRELWMHEPSEIADYAFGGGNAGQQMYAWLTDHTDDYNLTEDERNELADDADDGYSWWDYGESKVGPTERETQEAKKAREPRRWVRCEKHAKMIAAHRTKWPMPAGGPQMQPEQAKREWFEMKLAECKNCYDAIKAASAHEAFAGDLTQVRAELDAMKQENARLRQQQPNVVIVKPHGSNRSWDIEPEAEVRVLPVQGARAPDPATVNIGESAGPIPPFANEVVGQYSVFSDEKVGKQSFVGHAIVFGQHIYLPYHLYTNSKVSTLYVAYANKVYPISAALDKNAMVNQQKDLVKLLVPDPAMPGVKFGTYVAGNSVCISPNAEMKRAVSYGQSFQIGLHNCSTEPGYSGCAVLQVVGTGQWAVVGMHLSGGGTAKWGNVPMPNRFIDKQQMIN